MSAFAPRGFIPERIDCESVAIFPDFVREENRPGANEGGREARYGAIIKGRFASERDPLVGEFICFWSSPKQVDSGALEPRGGFEVDLDARFHSSD